MICIFCGHKLEVTNSRAQRKLNQVWRRRQCPDCKALFTTDERIDLSKSLRVQYNTKQIEPFWRDILFTSVYESCKHRDTAAKDATALTDTVITRVLRKKYGAIVTRDQLVAITTEVLRRFDKASLAHYKAFHPVTS